MRTSNVQRPTSNIELNAWKRSFLRRWTLEVGRSTFVLFCIYPSLFGFTTTATAQQSLQKHPRIPSLLQWEAAGAPRDPILSINHHIGYIVSDLTDKKTDLPVQIQQRQVVGELDTIIKQLEEQMKSGNGGGNPNPTKPMTKSVLAKGPGGSGPLHDPRAGTHQWGDLSPKEREQITQSQTEGFPPGYEAVLSSYYNRLAQEKVAGDAPAVEGPTTKPAGN